MGKDENVRTLCYKCKQNYETAGYVVKSKHTKYKSSCDYCGRCGYEYIIEERSRIYGKSKI